MKIQRSIGISADPGKIWPFLSQPLNIPKWCITFQRCEFTSQQRSGVGLPFYVEEKAGGPLMKIHFAVTEWVENRKLAFKMTSGNFVKAYEQSWTIEPLPSGSRFVFKEDVEMPWGIIGGLLGILGRSGSEKHVKGMLIRLKTLAES